MAARKKCLIVDPHVREAASAAAHKAGKEWEDLSWRARLMWINGGPKANASETTPKASQGRASGSTSGSTSGKTPAVPGDPETAAALELFKEFVEHGRGARAWRKNDFRMINSCVLPLLGCGDDAQLDWAHPNVALDQLNDLLQGGALNSAACRDLFGDEALMSSQVKSRPPLPPSASRIPTGPSRQGTGDLSSASRIPTGSSRQGTGDVSQNTSATPSRARSDSRTRTRESNGSDAGQLNISTKSDDPDRCMSPALAKSAWPQQRGSTPSSCSSSQGPPLAVPAVSHHDAVRARREAMEVSRKKSLQKALSEKADPQGGRGSEIEDLEQQIASGKSSAAAVVGLKKRLATLKATAIREQRAAEARARQQAEVRAVPTPAPQAEVPYQNSPSQEENDAWPAPAYPPPRAAQAPTSCSREAAMHEWSSHEERRTPTGYARGQNGRSPMGAASAPWGNAFSSDPDG